jgi:uncharacterized membrane protein
MDLLSAVKLYEKFDDAAKPTDSNTPVPESKMSTYSILITILSILISLYAVSLSWSCNTAANINTGLKVLYAIFAFIFGLIYLIFYLIFRAGTCGKVLVPAPIVAKGGKRN